MSEITAYKHRVQLLADELIPSFEKLDLNPGDTLIVRCKTQGLQMTQNFAAWVHENLKPRLKPGVVMIICQEPGVVNIGKLEHLASPPDPKSHRSDQGVWYMNGWNDAVTKIREILA